MNFFTVEIGKNRIRGFTQDTDEKINTNAHYQYAIDNRDKPLRSIIILPLGDLFSAICWEQYPINDVLEMEELFFNRITD